MVPKTGTKVPKLADRASQSEFTQAIGAALRSELGSSRRATKSVMGWAGVSDRTARIWLQGAGCPGGFHLVALSANCRPVMNVVLGCAGYRDATLRVELRRAEAALASAMLAVQELLDER